VAAAADRTPLMLIHGAWLSSGSWENFTEYFRNRGFAVAAPEWPRKQGDVKELREDADEIKGLGLTEIVDHYESQIRALDEPPVLIGHSYGGLIVELLALQERRSRAVADRGGGEGHGSGVALSQAV
jgi:pimeloyl-ACP methyl ester carboxylesterase